MRMLTSRKRLENSYSGYRRTVWSTFNSLHRGPWIQNSKNVWRWKFLLTVGAIQCSIWNGRLHGVIIQIVTILQESHFRRHSRPVWEAYEDILEWILVLVFAEDTYHSGIFCTWLCRLIPCTSQEHKFRISPFLSRLHATSTLRDWTYSLILPKFCIRNWYFRLQDPYCLRKPARRQLEWRITTYIFTLAMQVSQVGKSGKQENGYDGVVGQRSVYRRNQRVVGHDLPKTFEPDFCHQVWDSCWKLTSQHRLGW